MKTRQEIKLAARQQIQGNILTLFLVGLVSVLIISLVIFGVIVSIGGKIYRELGKELADSVTSETNEMELLIEILALHVKIFLIMSVVIMIISWVFGAVIEWGQVKNSNVIFKGEKATFRNGFAGCKQFGSAFSVYFMKILYLALWLMVAVVTFGIGIIVVYIKIYSYSCATFIKQEYPETGANAAITQSRDAMYGNKWRLFVQDLSFLGWFILSIFTLGILLIWVMPYFYQARYNFYQSIKQTVIESKAENLVETKKIEG